MTELQLACALPPGPAFADLAVLAESLGYARVWINDSAPLWEDPFVHLALAAERTTRIGFGTAVSIPTQRSEMAMAASIATVARLSGGRLRICFGTGFTARFAMGQRPMTLDALAAYTRAVRGLLAGDTVVIDGKPARMLHYAGLTAPRPIDVPLWLSVFGPRGAAMATEVADGVIGHVHPSLPTATMVAGTVLDPGESPTDPRVLEAIGPCRMPRWHSAYAAGGPAAVDALPGGPAWRAKLETIAPQAERHLLTFEGHHTHLTDRDRGLLAHIDTTAMVGDRDTLRGELDALSAAGYREVLYLPTGPDVARELRAFASVRG
ncbi:LLM class flavin-dependent oxidoreductase [Nocardia macrotermitis]|uniref:F420-dependent glucose-6-phosphate dehydrogenase n=1 Tax=Nocardia macrotermitis TaxID=2585198 RepID=A0A7K0D6T2_9NOCA|nr:LLM class flavin-dependent oxidoreductase [Nocardia macrotermitis]MQY21465.1 F420-dependent glucose-6-phosphate dehydrogenase [Nocardia macrotermitis]